MLLRASWTTSCAKWTRTSAQESCARCRDISDAPSLLDTFRSFAWGGADARPGKIPALAKRSLSPTATIQTVARNVWSVRIGPSHRALARRADDMVVWFWIGTHAEYNNLVQRLR